MSKLTQGIVQIYTGNGKGKTTAAFGLAIRALGQNFKVCIIQFMKGNSDAGELRALKSFEHCRIESFGSGKWVHKGRAFPEDIKEAQNALQYCREVISSGEWDLVIIDEIINAIWFELISEDEVLQLIDSKQAHVEVVLTGRNASKRLIDRAGLVTEMVQIKHPFEQGLEARKGIEF